MKLTKDWFKQQGMNSNGLDWVHTQFSDEIVELEATEIINRLITQEKEIAERYKNSIYPENSLKWANWIICEVFSEEQRIKYAIFAAEQVIDIHEEQYPDDSRPRNAIRVAREYLEDQSVVSVVNATNAAKGAAYAADYAANVARATNGTASSAIKTASYAASAASSAVNTIAYAANASYAASTAANAVGDASNEMRERILRYGLELLQA